MYGGAYPNSYLNPYRDVFGRAVGPAFVGLLDKYPGASICFSTRKLRTAYTGPCMRVRRSSDNTEQDIGFSVILDSKGNSFLNEVALLAFVGAGDGFVVTWYDQSGNARDAVQSTATIQPKIVNAGVVIKQNAKPVVSSVGVTGCFMPFNGDALINTDYFLSAIASRSSGVNNQFIFGGTTTTPTNRNLHLGWSTSSQVKLGQYGNDLNLTVPSFTSSTLELLSGQARADGKTTRNNNLNVSNTNTVKINATYIGCALFRTAANTADINLGELITYSSAQEANADVISSNQMIAFGVTP